MSMEAVRDFVKRVTESEELRSAWNAAEGAAGVVALAATNGFEFSTAELEMALGSRDLGEEELEQVAGGQVAGLRMKPPQIPNQIVGDKSPPIER